MDRLPAPPLPDWLSALVPFDRYLVPVGDGLHMHVMEGGSPSGRPVLMLHGNPTWGLLWRRVATALADDGLRLVMPDLIGLGFSSRVPASSHTLADHARWAGALIDGLALEDIVFAGQDWGGPVGVRALADRPGRMAGLVLGNTAVGAPREGFKPTPFHRFARLPVVSDLVFKGLGFPQVGLNFAQGERRSITGDVARGYRYPLRSPRDRVAPLAMARMVPDSLDHPSVRELRRSEDFVTAFTGPAAVVWGDNDPVLGRLGRRTLRMLPQASMTHTSAGHFLQEQVPDELAAAIRSVAAAL